MAQAIPPHQVCFKCGAMLDPRAKFCPDCGSALQPLPRAQSVAYLSKTTGRNWLIWTAGAAVTLWLLFVVWQNVGRKALLPQSFAQSILETLEDDERTNMQTRAKSSLTFDRSSALINGMHADDPRLPKSTTQGVYNVSEPYSYDGINGHTRGAFGYVVQVDGDGTVWTRRYD